MNVRTRGKKIFPVDKNDKICYTVFISVENIWTDQEKKQQKQK